MKGFFCGTMVLGMLAAGVWAQEQKQVGSPEEQYQALIRQFDEAQQQFWKEYAKAKTSEERRKLLENRPDPEEFSEKFLKLAADHPDDPVAIDALVWIVRRNRSGKAMEQALATLQERHITSDRLGPVCLALVYARWQGAEAFLQKVLKENPHKEVQGQACFALAQHVKQLREMHDYVAARPEMAERLEQFYGKAFMQRLQSTSAEELKAELEKLLERAAGEFADVSYGRDTIGKAAERELYELRHLSVGCVAPEIEGEDIDGKRFKLSDYRGKVVMLDFWGHW